MSNIHLLEIRTPSCAWPRDVRGSAPAIGSRTDVVAFGRYRMRKLWVLALGAATCCTIGCSTISTRRESTIKEGRDIPGTERYGIHITNVVQTAEGLSEKLVLKSDGATRRVDVERFEESWDMVERARYLSVAGVNADYSFSNDLIVDPIWGGLMALVSPIILIPTLMLPTEPGFPTYSERLVLVSRWIGTAVIGILPFINPCGDIDGVRETIRANDNRRRIEPSTRIETTRPDELSGKAVAWKIQLENGKEIGKGRIKWPEAIDIPLCKWVLANPAEHAFKLALASDTLDVSGAVDSSISFDLRDVVRRQWPDSTDAPQVRMSVESATLVGDDGKALAVLRAGTSTRIRVTVKNQLKESAPAYDIKPVLNFGSDLVQTKGESHVGLLRPGETSTCDVQLFAPAFAAGSEVQCRLGLIDLVGRRSPEVTIPLSIGRSERPALQIFLVTPMLSPKANSTNEITVVVRNRGQVPATRVMVDIRHLPPGCIVVGAPPVLDLIAANGQTSVAIPVRIGNISGRFQVNVEVSDSSDMDPIERQIFITIMPSDADSG